MANYQCVKLRFAAPLHLGRGVSETYDTGSRLLHSDTISSAIASARVQLFGDKNLKQFLESFSVSSAFPFYKGSLFFPKPMVKLNFSIENEDETRLGKQLKKLEYIEKTLFEKLLSGNKVQVKNEQFSPSGKYVWANKASNTEFITAEVQQRVTVPRDGQGESKPYYVERLFFDTNAGLFFLLDCTDNQTFREFELVLKYLEDSGIGTDRSVGNGFFKAEIGTLEFALPGKAEYRMNLSLFCPTKEELPGLMDGEPAYLLEKRGGFIAGAANEQFRHLRKKSVYMFTEGSVFKASEFQGKVLDIRPQWDDEKLHPVYRSGKPVGIPIVINQEQPL
jgi:CRISPR type III-A-associated RAMP protein Csm4